MSNLLDIIHYADIQLEIRTSGAGAQRFDEYRLALNHMVEVIELKRPQIVVIPGDVFEFWDCNGEEQKLFAVHLNRILPYIERLILIPGNHDIRQRGIALTSINEKRNLTDSIEAIVTAINSPKISYYSRSGLYVDAKFSITWAVWSQHNKHSMEDQKEPYSPWPEDDSAVLLPETKSVIELFHDPIAGARGFSGEPEKHFQDYKISLKNFRANTIIAGDIHAPDIIWFGENNQRLFTYSSSLVQRNFGEGDYYQNIKRFIEGNRKHGYNEIVFDIDNDRAVSCKFIPVKSFVSRHTFYISDKFQYPEMIKGLDLEYSTELNKIRLVCQGNLQKFIDHEQDFIEHFKSKYHCSIDFDHAQNVLGVEIDEQEFQDLEQLIDKDKILKISKTYIDQIVSKTSTIDVDDKEYAKEYIFKLLQQQLDGADLTNSRVDIQLLSAKISNFMSFSPDVDVDFRNVPITAITGTNGIGKTNLFHFIAWMFADKISANQNDRNKKYNYALYFNDASELDQVSGELRFAVNGDVHHLRKTITRSWKKDAKDIYNKDWINNLSGTPTLSLDIESSGFTSDSTEECLEYLSNLVTFSELQQLVFVNGSSLERLINTNSADLSDKFLKTIGLDITQEILSKFNALKDERLSKLNKPNMSVQQALDQIALAESSENELLNDIESRTEKMRQLKETITKETQASNTLRSTLHQVGTKEEIIAEIESFDKKKAEIEVTIVSHEESISQLNDKKLNSSYEQLKTQLNQREKDQLVASHQIDQNNLKLETVDQRITEIKATATEVINDIKKDLQYRVDHKKATITDKEGSIRRTKENREDLLHQYQAPIKEYLQKLNAGKDKLKESEQLETSNKHQQELKLSEAKSEISIAELKINGLKSEIDDLSNSKICSQCGSDLKGEQLQLIQNKINDKSAELDKCQNELQLKNTACDDIKNQIQKFEQSLTEIKSKIKTVQAAIDQNQEKIDSNMIPIESEELYRQFKQQVDIADKFQKEIDALQLEIIAETADDYIMEKVKNDKRYLDHAEQLKKFNKAKELITSKGTELDEALEEINNDIESIKNQIEEINSIDQKIESYQQLIKTNKDQIEDLNNSIQRKKNELDLAAINVETNKKIDEIDLKLVQLNDSFDKANDEKVGFEQQIQKLKSQVETLRQTIQDIKTYKLVDSSLKLYKKLLGKTGLPQYIFAHLVPLINKRLNESLVDVNFRLIFDSDSLDLRFVDLHHNVSRPVQFISGMQQTIVGVALINILRILNNSKKFNVLMVDEVSGKLNDGSNLSYQAKNYHQLFKNFIDDLSKHANIYIVDHVLEFDNARVLEVQPTDNGAIIAELSR